MSGRSSAPSAPRQASIAGRARYKPSRSHAVPMLQVFGLTIFVFPANTVIKAVGAQGYVGGLVGMFMFGAFIVATLFGLHNPLERRHPIRAAILVLWVSILLSYIVMDRAGMTAVQLRSADRLLMQLAIISGVALVAAECLDSLADIRRVLRALTWGGAFCAGIAALQFFMRLDLTPYLRMLPGFTLNSDDPSIVARGAVNRVQGTTATAIELGVVAGMLLPLAIYLALHDTERKALNRWAPVALLGIGVTTSVSRSGIIALVLTFGVLIALMPVRQRMLALAAAPVGVVAVYMSAHGVISTLLAFFTAGSSDASVQARLVDYPYVAQQVNQAPWLGHGGGTYMPVDLTYILDNQWLKTAIDNGFVGVVALAVYFVVPFFAALITRWHTRNPELRMLCAALAGPVLAASVCSFTFDSLSFPTFSCVYALVIGIIGACWRIAADSQRVAAERELGRPGGAVVRGERPALSINNVKSAEG